MATLHIFNALAGTYYGVDCGCGYRENFEDHDEAIKAVREHNFKCQGLGPRIRGEL